MNSHLLQLIDGFSGLKVIVIGEAMLDHYLNGFSERLCREAPVPVVTVTGHEAVPGGAANAGVNVSTLGATVHYISVIGDDVEGKMLRASLEERGVAGEHLIVHPERRTIAKNRIVGATQMFLRFDEGTVDPLDRETEERVIERLTSLYPQADAVIVSDYGYGVVTPRIVRAIARLQAETPRPLIVDAKDLSNYRDVGVTAVKPNYKEALALIGDSGNGHHGDEERQRPEFMLGYGDRILEMTGSQIAAVTLDTDGALIFERDRPPYRTYADPQPHSYATGAGDTFVGAFVMALAANATTPEAAEIASAAAAVVVSRNGTTTCSADELRGHLSSNEKCVEDLDVLAARAELYRKHEKQIVFTNGCFDILHRGHITYLNRAKEQGDVLVVGVNSDDSIRRLKGPSRPINGLEDRIEVLAALSCIDHIIPFS